MPARARGVAEHDGLGGAVAVPLVEGPGQHALGVDRWRERNRLLLAKLFTPEEAAQEMVKGWEQGRFEIHFPKRFTLWLKAMRHLAYRPYFAAVRRSTGL